MTDSSASSDPWPAPTAPGAVDATVRVPGSKSVTNRALVLAALSAEPGWLRRPLRSYGQFCQRQCFMASMLITF